MDMEYYKKYEPIDGKWYLTKELGNGAFGRVFEVQRHDFPDMKAALKIVSIPATQGEVKSYQEENFDLDEESITSYFYGFVEEFVREFRLMSQLKGHTNIVSYEDHDVKKREGEIGWDIFIRMELLSPMNKYFINNTPTKKDVLKLGIDICTALEVCKKYNIIHRDIKPSNIFVSETGDYKLGDFGVARTLEKTSSGLSKKGTYTYMAPEVFKGEKYGANVDIYSLGIVMYRLLNNNMEPFRTSRSYSDGELALEQRMTGKSIPKPANADGKLAEIILKACSYNPKERYSSATEMKEDLTAVLEDMEIGKKYAADDVIDFEPSNVSASARKEKETHLTENDSETTCYAGGNAGNDAMFGGIDADATVSAFDKGKAADLYTVAMPQKPQKVKGQKAPKEQKGKGGKKRILIIAATLCIVAAIGAAATFLMDGGSDNGSGSGSGTVSKSDAEWSFDDGVLTIEGEGAMENYSSSAETPWMKHTDDIEKIIISEGITAVGEYAFNGCGELTDVKLPDNLETIGSGAFGNCSSLREVELPVSIKSLSSDLAFDPKHIDTITYDGTIKEWKKVENNAQYSMKFYVVCEDGTL